MNFIKSLMIAVTIVALVLFSPFLVVITLRILVVVTSLLLYPFNLIAQRLEFDHVEEDKTSPFSRTIEGDIDNLRKRA